MPELPEVQTTVDGLNKTVKGRKIVGVWSGYKSPYFQNKDEIKNPKFFTKFKKLVVGQKILKAERRAKNILIHLSNKHTILIHMKMTGHMLFGKYRKVTNNRQPTTDKWAPEETGPLQDPFNKHLRLVFSLDNGRRLAFSDLRKFAKITIVETGGLEKCKHLMDLGPEPLEKNFQFPIFNSQLHKRPKTKIKTALMDQTLIAGIGNIYSDEILWRAGVHPISVVEKIPEKNLKLAFKAMREVLNKGIDLGGDSMSDYRNIYGKRGKFQEHHRAYQKHKTKCSRKGCSGILEKMVVGGRSAHFCPVHQKLYK